ncbi:MAG: RrF2 family transcriptional regulator [Gemmatimonadota bacterium]
MLTLPQTAEYALRAVYFIAESPGGTPVPVSDIASALQVPRNYLSKTLHQLARAGVLQSTRGQLGGFQLASSPERLMLGDVVRPFLPAEGRACVLGRERCSDLTPCAAHFRWKEASERMRRFFDATTVADLLKGKALPAA